MRTAMRARVPIVPVAVVGAEEAMPIFAHLPLLQRLTGLIYFPVNHAFPHFGLAAALMYLPAKFKIRFLEPVDLSRYGPEDAEDVGQEVFRAVARKIQDFQHGGPGQTFRGWLRTITRNKVADLMRAYRAKGRGAGWEENYLAQIPAEESAADELSAADENKLVVRRAVELLRAEFEARTWQAFWRVTVDGDCPDDVARELGMTVNAVYLAKSRILRRLRAEFAGLIEIEAGAP